MSKIGLFFGTQTGKTESIAEMIRDQFGADQIDLHDMSQVSVSDFDGYTKLIIASPTWDIGELQSDWDGFCAVVERLITEEKKQWNPVYKKMMPWIDMKSLGLRTLI